MDLAALFYYARGANKSLETPGRTVFQRYVLLLLLLLYLLETDSYRKKQQHG